MLKATLTTIFLTTLLVSCGHVITASRFCDLAEPMLTDRATGKYILAHDRALAVNMAVQNRLLKKCPKT